MRVEDHKMRRFNFLVGYDNQFSVEESPDGKWVAWESVEPLIKAYLSLNNMVNGSELIKDEISRIHRGEVNGH